MTRWAALLLLLAACAEQRAPAPATPVNTPASPSGPVLGPAMAPAERPPVDPNAAKPELLAPATFPPAQKTELDLASFVPGSVESSLRDRFAAAEASFVRGEDAAADKAYAALPKGGALAPWLTLARIRVKARREAWPTSVGSGDADKRVAAAITSLSKLDWAQVPTAAQGPFHLELGRWLLVHGDYERARASLDQAVKSLPNEAEVLSLLGLARLATGQIAEALDPIERATALDLGSAARWGNLGTIRMMNGKINEAARAYEARLRLAPEDGQAHADLGVALVQLGELTRGQKELEAAVQREPTRPGFWANLGYAQHRAGRRAEARASFEKALAQDPKLLVGLLGLAALYAESPTERAKAKPLLERATAIAPDDPRVIAAKDDLAQLEKSQH